MTLNTADLEANSFLGSGVSRTDRTIVISPSASHFLAGLVE